MLKALWEAIVLTFALYSRIPMPRVEWNKNNMRFSLVFFPVVGAVIAAALYLLVYISGIGGFSPVFTAALAVAFPVALTGGLHFDGYSDTVDALCSRREKEEKLRILKDPHLGAFAVIYTAVAVILQFGAWYQVLLLPRYLFLVLISFLLSRSLTGLALVAFPCASQNGLAAVFAGNTRKKPVRIILGLFSLICLLAAFRLDIWAGMPAAIWAVLSFYWFHRVSKKNFGGLTGDLAGFYIVVYETGMIVLAAILGGIRS